MLAKISYARYGFCNQSTLRVFVVTFQHYLAVFFYKDTTLSTIEIIALWSVWLPASMGRPWLEQYFSHECSQATLRSAVSIVVTIFSSVSSFTPSPVKKHKYCWLTLVHASQRPSKVSAVTGLDMTNKIFIRSCSSLISIYWGSGLIFSVIIFHFFA